MTFGWMILIWCDSPTEYSHVQNLFSPPLGLRWWWCCSYNSEELVESSNGGSSESDRRGREAVEGWREPSERGRRLAQRQEAQIWEVPLDSLGVLRRARRLLHFVHWSLLHLLDHARYRLRQTQAASQSFGSSYAQVRSFIDSFVSFLVCMVPLACW